MRVTGRTALMGSVLALAVGWAFYDFLGGAAGFYVPAEPETGIVRARPASEPANKPRTEVQARSESINPLGAIVLASLAQTIERPLFSQSRAPKPKPQPEAAEATEEEPQPQAEDFAVLAIVVSGDRKTALVRVNKTSEVFRLKPGDTFSGWKLTAVEPKAIVIANQDLSFPLKLFAQPADAMQVPGQRERRRPGVNTEEWDEDDQEAAISRLER
jgi:hypothetical protein